MDTTQPRWVIEHGEEYAVPEVITNLKEFVDNSWHNDACPSFTADIAESGRENAHTVTIWVNAPPETPGEYERFHVVYSWDSTGTPPAVPVSEDIAPDIDWDAITLYMGDDAEAAAGIATEVMRRVQVEAARRDLVRAEERMATVGGQEDEEA